MRRRKRDPSSQQFSTEGMNRTLSARIAVSGIRDPPVVTAWSAGVRNESAKSRAVALYTRTVGQRAQGLKISESCLRRWILDLADIDEGAKPGLMSTERKELVELRRENRCCGWSVLCSRASRGVDVRVL